MSLDLSVFVKLSFLGRNVKPFSHVFRFVTNDTQEIEKKAPTLNNEGLSLSYDLVGKHGLCPIKNDEINLLAEKSF